jgi:hypothetical protein
MNLRDVKIMRRLAAESADGRGRVAEELLLDAVKRVGTELPWFKEARSAEPGEDSRGIDIVVIAKNDRRFYLQSKSSRGKAINFESKKREDTIAVIVVSLDERNNERLAKEAMEKLYNEERTCVAGDCRINVDSQDRRSP